MWILPLGGGRVLVATAWVLPLGAWRRTPVAAVSLAPYFACVRLQRCQEGTSKLLRNPNPPGHPPAGGGRDQT